MESPMVLLELLDGSVSHANSLEANELRAKYTFLSLKEEVDSSHINQAYDCLTAKSNKRAPYLSGKALFDL
jgi:hypothetical protein